MYEAAKEAYEGPERDDSGSRTGLALMDDSGRGQVLYVHSEQAFRPAPQDTKRLIRRDGMRVRAEESPTKMYTEEELRQKMALSYGIESRAGHGLENLEIEYIGTIQTTYDPKRFYKLYEDSEGNCWHKTMFLVDGVLITDTEYIFGMKK